MSDTGTGARPHVVVVGGGIAGLAAAHALVTGPAAGAVRVTLVEATDRLGGKIRTEPFAGVPLDTGPDAFLARVPWAAALCRDLGLGDEMVSPAAGSAYLWSRGRLRRLPDGLVLGVPAQVLPLARSGVLSPLGVARAGLDLVLPGRPRGDGTAPGAAGQVPTAVGEDISVGSLIRRRLGGEVLERLVDPLVGGINAGDADHLSLDASVPQLAAAAARHRSMIMALRAQRKAAPPATTDAPVFYSLPAGLEQMVHRLGEVIGSAGVEVRLGTQVTELAPSTGGYRLELSAPDGSPEGPLEAAAVVMAAPAFAAADLLAPVSPTAGRLLGAVEHASVTLVTFAFPTGAVPRELDASGFLVPRTEGRLMTACSWSSSKWAHLAAPDRVLLRVSAGRHGDDRAMHLDDDELVGRLLPELADSMGITATPAEQRVVRWDRAFPQYTPGHLDRVGAIEAALAADVPGVEVAGAAYRGVGIPACIRQGQEAAARIATRLGH